MSNERRPWSLDGIKRLAKSIKAERGISHREALELSARQAGFQSYTHARRRLDTPETEPAVADSPARPTQGAGGRDAFLAQCRQAWLETLDVFNRGREDRVIWNGTTAIKPVLDRVLAHARSHAHLPTGGGQDFSEVRRSREAGCLEFQVERGAAYLARPKSLILERIARSPAQSFLLLELENLAPSGAYSEEADDAPDWTTDWFRRREEVVELAPGDYVERSVWDEGNLGYDETGREIPLPDGARLVVRWFNGKMLFVTKGSLWNGTSGTYDGRHDSMSAEDIRAMIERSLPTDLAAE